MEAPRQQYDEVVVSSCIYSDQHRGNEAVPVIAGEATVRQQGVPSDDSNLGADLRTQPAVAAFVQMPHGSLEQLI